MTANTVEIIVDLPRTEHAAAVLLKAEEFFANLDVTVLEAEGKFEERKAGNSNFAIWKVENLTHEQPQELAYGLLLNLNENLPELKITTEDVFIATENHLLFDRLSESGYVTA